LRELSRWDPFEDCGSRLESAQSVLLLVRINNCFLRIALYEHPNLALSSLRVLTHLTPAPASKYPSWQRLPTSPGSKTTRIQHWLQCCEQNHSGCTPKEQTPLPKRLIDLFPNGKHDGHAKLVVSENIAERHPKYTTLSYCWGDDRNFKTTCAVVEAFYQDIPSFELPHSFADAFHLTRQLDIRYIWIDALCIIQDDKLDWKTEVATMHNVYAGSFLTIQASEARSSSGGCFVPIDPILDKAQPYKRALFTTLEASGDFEISVHVVPHRPWAVALNERGWTFQEAILSHRIIQLTNSELHWRCRSDLLWETGIPYKSTERLYGNVPPLQKMHNQRWDTLWWSWMENYSERRFSFPSDRLPGIAGLVELYQRETSDEPCLGLWRRSLHADLTWCRIGTLSERSIDPPLSQSLPSWSPFACCQTIELKRWNDQCSERSPIQYTTEVLDCTIAWSGTPFLSNLHWSKLVIRGPTREIYLSEATDIKDCNPPYFNVNDEVTDPRELPLPWRCAVQWDKEGYREPGKWLCLLLQRQTPIGFEFGAETFLVLEGLEDNGSERAWRRIGIGSLGRHRRSRNALGELGWIFNIDTCQTITLE
jgi:hypothetical protein